MWSLKFLSGLFREHRAILALILVAGALSGLFSAGIVAAINALLHPHFSYPLVLLAVGFVGLVSGKIVSNVLSQLWLVQFAQDAIVEMTLGLCRKLLQTSLRKIEQLGGARIFMTLTDDVGSVVWAVQCVPSLMMNAAMIAGCGLYLFWLSPAASIAVVMASLIGAGGYYEWHRRSYPLISAARDAKATVFGEFRLLTDGIKELLMDGSRGRYFLEEELRLAVDAMKRRNLVALKHQLVGDSWTQSFFYLLIGLLLLVLPGMLPMSLESLTGFVFAILFLMNPLWGVIGALPITARGQVALSRLNELGLSLGINSVSPGLATANASRVILSRPLHLKDVRFAYQDAEGNPSFLLGPLCFSVHPGELVMIVGGNGSGKSTFAKVLTGLYAPDSGLMTFGGTPVTNANVGWYRQHVSVVFADYHLFDRLLGADSPERIQAVERYLAMFQLANKVHYTNGKFSTIDLSQGQRRRLALISALVDDKPICVFDEWAADQDPTFKLVFYNTILPDLCRRGKAVVVITHDDRYFTLANRVVKLEDGRIVDQMPVLVDSYNKKTSVESSRPS